MEDAKISVIVPVYKVEQVLARCIDSILHQTFRNLEIILVDDGSPDKCGSICDQYQKRDGRIKVIHKCNGGLSDARNAGIEIATGAYIGFVDSDDYIHPRMYELLYGAIKQSGADIAACQRKLVYSSLTEFEAIPDHVDETICDRENALIDLLTGNNYFYHAAWEKLYRRQCFETIRFPVGELYEDQAVMYRVFDQVNKVAYVDAKLYYWYMRDGSITHQKLTKDIIEYILKHPLEAINYFEDKKELVLIDAAKIYLLRTILMQWHGIQRLNNKNLCKRMIQVYRKHYRQINSVKGMLGIKGWLFYVSPNVFQIAMHIKGIIKKSIKKI